MEASADKPLHRLPHQSSHSLLARYPAESVAVLVSNKERRLLAKPKRRPRLWLKLTSLNRISRSAQGKTDSKHDLSRLQRYAVHWDYYRFRPRVYTAFITSESS